MCSLHNVLTFQARHHNIIASLYTAIYILSLTLSVALQVKVPFGDAVISTGDTVFGCETCEELFTGNRLPSSSLLDNSSFTHVPAPAPSHPCLALQIPVILYPLAIN